MVLTILEATVAPDRAADLQTAFRAAARAAGAEPSLSIYDVAATIEAPRNNER